MKIVHNPLEPDNPKFVWIWRIIVVILLLWLAVHAHAQNNYDANGNLLVNCGACGGGGAGGGTSSSFGSPFPATGTAAGFKDTNGNMAGGLLDLSGNLLVDVANTVTVTGTVTANQGGTWTVQQGGAPWSVSQSGTWTVQQGTPPWSVNVNNTPTVNQGGAPWSVSQSGTWNVNSTPSSTFGAPFPATGDAAGFKDFGGLNMAPGNLDAYGNLRVVVAAVANILKPTISVLPRQPAPIPVLTNQNPCQTNVAGDQALSQAGTAQVLTGRPGLRILICHERIIAGAAEQISEMEGTGSNCATGTVFHSGSSTAANGEPLAANGGFESISPFYLLPGNNYCIQQAGTARIAGKVSYLYVP